MNGKTLRPDLLDVHVWNKNGDHPRDKSVWINPEPSDRQRKPFLSEGHVVRIYNVPGPEGIKKCTKCGNKMNGIHGWIDNAAAPSVCPSDYIVTDKDGGMSVWSKDKIHELYK